MKDNIDIKKVEDLAIAIVPREPHEEGHEDFWDAYIINLRDEPIRSVIVNASGYGEIEGEMRRTSTLRYFWEAIESLGLERIEPIHKPLFDIANEYWVSFTFGDYLYDKKYIFVQGALDENNFTDIPFLDRRGVMIR